MTVDRQKREKITYQKPAPSRIEQSRRTDNRQEEEKPVVEPSATKGDRRSAIVSYATSFVGTRYRYGGRDATGFDCSGFTCFVMKKFGLRVPPTSTLQATGGQKIHWKSAQPGDLIFFGDHGKVNHVGIVTQNAGLQFYVVHSTSSSGVRVDEIIGHPYWRSRVLGVVSYLDQPGLDWRQNGND